MDINLISPINMLGYGIAGLNILKALVQEKHSVSLWPIGNVQAHIRDVPTIKEAEERSHTYNPEAPCVRLWHQHDLSLFAGHGKHFGFPIFELNNFTKQERHQLDALSGGIIVCSEWAKKVLKEQNVLQYPIYVVPLGVDRSIFHDHIYFEPVHTTVFFNCGKWEIRKGHDILVDAFNKAFTTEENVKLIMHCENPFLSAQANREWAARYTKSKLGKEGKIFVSPARRDTQQELFYLMSSVDCGIFPSRAEGWNLEALELMSLGKQVILTDYSAHTEYANKDNSLLIKVDKLEPAVDKIWFNGQGEWAHLGIDQIDNLIYHMRQVHKAKQEGVLFSNYAGVKTAKLFSWSNTAKRLIECVSQK